MFFEPWIVFYEFEKVSNLFDEFEKKSQILKILANFEKKTRF
jgi:hypothetical protein